MCRQVALKLFDCIKTGPDWLDHPDVQEFLRRQGLADVRVQLVGPRRTFAGKTYPAWSFMRMVAVGVHPVRWLVTFIHELAHVKDYRKRMKDLEKELGRPLQRRDGRTVWQMERPHGQRWQQEFVKLAKVAVEAGLFPGNEERVMRIAAESTTTLDDAELDLCADPRVEAEELRRLDEQRQEQILQAQTRTEALKKAFKAGQEVHFDAGPRLGVVTAKFVRLNAKSFTVEADGCRWHVPLGLLQPGPGPANAAPPKSRPGPTQRFHPGDEVAFRYDGKRHEGKIIRVNRKTCTVETLDGRWRVAFSLLKPR